MAPDPFLLTPTLLCFWEAARQVSHIPLHHQIKEQLLVFLWASRRFRGAALETSRDSSGRTEIKPKKNINGEKRRGRKSRPEEQQATVEEGEEKEKER